MIKTTVKTKDLLHAIKKVEKTKAKSSYADNPLSNVSMKFKGRYIEFCTTDGNYLNLTKIESDIPTDENIEVKFEPTIVLNYLKNLGKAPKVEIIYEGGLKFSCFGSELTVICSHTNYPKYEQLIQGYDVENDFKEIGRTSNIQKICINRKYLKNILDTMSDDEIEIKFDKDNNLVPLELANHKNNYEYAMLMPIMMR